MSLPRVLHAEEILDQPQADPERLRHSLEHVAQVNRFLGGNRGILRALRALLPKGGRVLDVGTGSGALPRTIVEWARKSGRPIRVTAVDVHPQTLEIAREACGAYPEIEVQQADALRLPFQRGAFDVAVMSLTLHHFEGADELQVLRELGRVGRTVLVSELERCWPNYLGARLLAATWWRSNAITRHDGPLSVLRAYAPAELRQTAHNAGLTDAGVQRHFFFRLQLIAHGPR